MQEAVAEGLVKIVGKELDDAYMQGRFAADPQ